MAQTLVTRELFESIANFNAGSPGSLGVISSGTWYGRGVGPRVSPTAAPGFSADVRRAAFDSYWNMTTPPYNAALPIGAVGFWIRFTSLGTATTVGHFSKFFAVLHSDNTTEMLQVGVNQAGSLLVNDANAGTVTIAGVFVKHTWYYVIVEFKNISAVSVGYRVYTKPLGGNFTLQRDRSAGFNPGSLRQFSYAHMRNVQVGSGGNWDGRIGSVGLYSLGAFGEGAVPGDLIDPVEQSHSWYVNPDTGSDANVGLTPATAWKTSTKLAAEVLYSGVLGSTTPWKFLDGSTPPALTQSQWATFQKDGALVPNGDTIHIDTSTAPLYLTEQLEIFGRAPGLHITSITDHYADLRAYKVLSAGGWSKTGGYTNIYQSADTETGVVLWEDLKWLNHPVGANLAAVGASLDATPGSFWTDGVTMYVHPFGSTNPGSDGKTYARSQILGNVANHAVTISGGDCLLNRLKVGGTALVQSGSQDLPANTNHYCIQANASNNVVRDCYGYYGAKHIVGTISGVNSSAVVHDKVKVEQGTRYTGNGGQTAFVLYAAGLTNLVGVLKDCVCVANQGAIGSTAGEIDNLDPTFYTHNAGAGTQWDLMILENCQFPAQLLGQLNNGVTGGVQLTACRLGLGTFDSATLNRCLVDWSNVVPNAGGTVTVKNSIYVPLATPATALGEYRVQGTLTLTNCTIDLRKNAGSGSNGFLIRFAAATLTVRNLAFITKDGTQIAPFKAFLATDTLVVENNVYLLGSNGIVSVNYNGSDRSFAQWQGLGFDLVSKAEDPELRWQDYRPKRGSPVVGAGLNLGRSDDFSGRFFDRRNDIGAYEFRR